MAEFNIPTGKAWRRWNICPGLEVSCWKAWTASTWGECDRVTFERNRVTYFQLSVPEGKEQREQVGLQMQQIVTMFKTAYDAGAADKLQRIKKELEL